MPGPCRWPPSRALAFSSTWPAWIGRIRRLQTIDPESRLGADVLQFVRAGLVPALGCSCGSRSWTSVKRAESRPTKNSALPIEILSPSDFGFHNALLDREGNVRFFDFEYAGWDDPAKLVCDFFCQVELPVPRRLYSSFCESIASRLPEPERVRQRIDVLFPVYQLKWCCIVLNEFLPVGQARRQFSGAYQRPARQPEMQLAKARRMLAAVADLDSPGFPG